MKSCWLPDNKKAGDILLAPNAFKGSLSATEFCRILSDEFRDTAFRIHSFPLCDGGDGSAAILASYFQARPVTTGSCDALGRPHSVTYYISGHTAILDIASVCGLKDLSPAEYDVLNARTEGLGRVICDAHAQGCRRIILGLGGSASIDGGTAALEKMGLKIVNSVSSYRNHLIGIQQLSTDQLNQNFKDTEFLLLCDVSNPLCGPEGAAAVFGPQKGASPEQVSWLDRELLQYAKLGFSLTEKDMTTFEHGGAAGGVAAAFAAFLNARLVPGARYCLEHSGFRQYLPSASMVITGEGKLDNQSFCGKLPGEIASLCQQHRIPVIAIAGSASLSSSPFRQIYQLIDYAGNIPASIRQAGYYLRIVAKEIKKNYLNSI